GSFRKPNSRAAILKSFVRCRLPPWLRNVTGRDDFTTPEGRQLLVNLLRNRRRNEVNAAVRKAEVGPAWMQAAETGERVRVITIGGQEGRVVVGIRRNSRRRPRTAPVDRCSNELGCIRPGIVLQTV